MEIVIRSMPESFGDKDRAELHHNLLTSLGTCTGGGQRQEVATSFWSAENRFDIDLGDVDWHKYQPPSVLRKAPNVTSLVLLDIIVQSIDNVKARVAKEDQVKEHEEDRRLLIEEEEEEEEVRKNGKSLEPYLPIIIPPRKLTEPQTALTNDKYSGTSVGLDSTITGSSQNDITSFSLSRVNQRRRNPIRRFFQRAPDYGESSTGGHAREALRQKLQARLSRVDLATTDSKTQVALTVWRKSGLVEIPETPKLEPEVECVSCLDDILVKNAVKVPCHSYCKYCFVRLVAAAVQHEAQWPPKCCLNQISSRLIVKNIPGDLKKTFQERSSEWELPVRERVYCNQSDCGIWIRPKHINLNKRQGRCERGHLTCTICRAPSHGNSDCPQDHDMNLTNTLAEEEGWKRCFNCHALVEHREACQHMTCRCGTEFCYVCGLQWKTCNCTMQQLYAVKEAAETRREQRHFQEQIETEELLAILAQIEEFEREEARRAEIDRLEQVRLEEERWQRQIKERIRLENVRRMEIAAKFRELRIHLRNLHQLQQAMMQTQQEDQATSLLQEAFSIKDNLAERHEMKRHEFHRAASEKVAIKEEHFKREYCARVTMERKVEDEYLLRLQNFWSGKPQANEEVERAMYALRNRMNQGHEMWRKWKDDQISTYKAKLDDQQMTREEVMYSEKERTRDSYEAKELELTRRMVAEKKWFQEIVLERESLLESWEVQETEGDADSLYMLEGEAR